MEKKIGYWLKKRKNVMGQRFILVMKIQKNQLLIVQMNARIGPLCLSSGQMTSEKIVVLKMDAPVAVRQVQHPMELALWFLTVAIDCISLMARVNIFHKIPMNISQIF